jgi:hypothetical protein
MVATRSQINSKRYVDPKANVQARANALTAGETVSKSAQPDI